MITKGKTIVEIPQVYSITDFNPICVVYLR
jgi:hypothetical protein